MSASSAKSALTELASAAGIDPDYRSGRGEAAASSDDALIAALRALAPDLGIVFDGAGDATAALAELARTRTLEVVPPVLVAWDG